MIKPSLIAASVFIGAGISSAGVETGNWFIVAYGFASIVFLVRSGKQ